MTTGTGLWNGLILNDYSLPYTLSDPPLTPGIPDYGFSFFYGGDAKGACTVEDRRLKKRRLRFGMGQIIPPYAGIAWQWRSHSQARENVKAVSLYLSADLFTRIAVQALDIEPRGIEIPENVGFIDELMGRIALELKFEAENGLPRGKIYGETAAQFLAAHILRYYATVHWKLSGCHTRLSRAHLDTVREFIDANLGLEISLEDLAGLCGLSVYHFARLFKQSMGMPPHQYLIGRRMDKAKQLLRATRLPMLDIALAVGYRNQSHFSALFKRCVGVTPSKYRAQC